MVLKLGSIFRTTVLGLTWPLAVVALVLSCLAAANGHWKPRAASIFTAIVACLTIITVPFLILSKMLRLGRYSGARCQRMWEVILTGLWLASWVWIATQLNKFHCTNQYTTTTTTSSVSTNGVVNNNLGFSFYGHALTPSGAPREALEAAGMLGMGEGEDRRLLGRALGPKGRRRYSNRCRIFKALLGFAIPIFVLFALDLLSFIWRASGKEHHVLPRSHSITPSVSSVSSVGSPRVTTGTHHGHHPVRDTANAAAAATETKV